MFNEMLCSWCPREPQFIMFDELLSSWCPTDPHVHHGMNQSLACIQLTHRGIEI